MNEQPVTPQPELNSPAKKKSGGATWIYLVALIFILPGVFWFRHHRQAAAVNAAATTARAGNFPVPVTIGHARQKDVPIYLDGLGTVQAFNTVTVHTRVDGQLVKVAFTEGQEVTNNEVLAQIDPAPYQAVVDQATAKKAQDAAQLANAKADLQRYDDLLKTQGTTQQVYDTQQALVNQLAASVKADQAAVDAAQVNLDYCTIRSPLDGRVGIRLVDQGNLVHASDAGGLVLVTQLKPISVVFTLPEANLQKIHANEDAENPFTVLAVSRDNTTVLATGQLAVIDNQIDSTTGTIKIKANFANENLRLWPGEFVNIRLLLETRQDAVVVPASVVQRGPDGSFAFVVSAAPDNSTNQIATMRPIKVGQIDGGEALIEEGLKAGETVVVDGQYKLQDGSKVKPAAPTDGSGGSRRNGQYKNQGTNQVQKP